MRKAVILLFAFGIFSMSCSEYEIDPKIPKLDMDFAWPKDQECFDKRSPAITIKEIPEGTKSVSVTLYDRSFRRDHGGGTVHYEGKNIIPEGAVTGTYEGPCPSGWGASPEYELTVKALDDSGKVLGIGKKIKAYPDKEHNAPG